MSIQAQDADTKEALKSYDKANDTLLMTYFKAKANEVQLKELGRDSLPESYRYRISKVHYSPDNAFKIFVFSGMFRDGETSIGFHYSVTQFASGYIEEKSGFSYIYNITAAGKGSYIIIDYDTFSDEDVQTHILKLKQYRLENNKLALQQLVTNDTNIPVALKDYFSKDKTSFLVALPLDTPFKHDFITYDTKKKTISYNYTYYPGAANHYPDYIPQNMVPNLREHLIVKGSFKLDSGTISGFKEEYQKTL